MLRAPTATAPCAQVRNGSVVRILPTTAQEASADPDTQHLFAKVRAESVGMGARESALR